MRFIAPALVCAIAISLSACSDATPQVGSTDGAAKPPGDPGALVAVTATSQVGVLLDEIPASMRHRVANALIAKPRSSGRTAPSPSSA